MTSAEQTTFTQNFVPDYCKLEMVWYVTKLQSKQLPK